MLPGWPCRGIRSFDTRPRTTGTVAIWEPLLGPARICTWAGSRLVRLGRLLKEFELSYFTHSIEGKLHGGWFRALSPDEVEVLGIGMMETVACAGFDPETTARSVLEEFVRRRAQYGAPIPALGERLGGTADQDTAQTARPRD